MDGTDSAVITELAPLQLVLNFPSGTELGNNSNNNGNHTNNNNNKKLGRKRILNWLTLYMNRPKIYLCIQIHKYNILVAVATLYTASSVSVRMSQIFFDLIGRY